jgi:hypothetical protein
MAMVQKRFPNLKVRRFPPSVKKGAQFDMPDGIIAHLTRECGGNVHDRHVVDVTGWSFKKETNSGGDAMKNIANMTDGSFLMSVYRKKEEDMPHTKNNWLCYNFNERRIVPTHYAIRTNGAGLHCSHLKSWLVETSADGESWRGIAREENNRQLNNSHSAGTFAVAGCRECRFTRLVNIGRNHSGNDQLAISAWEIFRSLIE